MTEDPKIPTIAEAARDIAAGELSPVALVEMLLERIEALNPSDAGTGAHPCPSRSRLRTKVPRPTSPDVRPRRSASAYPRDTVPTVTPTYSARSRCVGRRVPTERTPVSTSFCMASAMAK